MPHRESFHVAFATDPPLGQGRQDMPRTASGAAARQTRWAAGISLCDRPFRKPARWVSPPTAKFQMTGSTAIPGSWPCFF